MPYTYTQSSVAMEIDQDLVSRGREGRLGLDLFPDVPRQAAKVRWTQKDNYFGLQQMRGMDGRPLNVKRVKRTTYEYNPAVFGEFQTIDEQELVSRSQNIDLAATPVDISDLVNESKTQLIGRELDRKEASIWTLLTTGTLKITIDGPNGKQQTYSDSYTIQTFTAPIPWATSATATPILNFQAAQQLGYAAGHSVNFGAGAVAYMNGTTAFRLINNNNANDYGGRRTMNGSTINNLNAANSYWAGQGLANMVIYDGGYIPRIGGTFKKFIPDGVVVLIGQRPGNPSIGQYQLTRQANGATQPYMFVKNFVDGVNAPKEIPGHIEVHRGHNGGPAIYYPSAILVMSV